MDDTTTPQDGRDDASRPFDQTNGLAEGLDGDSDGTAASDTASEPEREVTSYGLIGDALGDHDQEEQAVREDDQP